MKTYLVFPNHRTATEFGYTQQRTPITWTRNHPLSTFDLGILLDEYGNSLDWYRFRLLHHRAGAHLETSDHITVRRTLGLLPGEHPDWDDYIRPIAQKEPRSIGQVGQRVHDQAGFRRDRGDIL